MVAALVVLAALSFSVAGCFMKLSNGLTVLAPTVMMAAFVTFGTSMQAFAMRGETMTVVYVMVLGLEAVTAYLLGTLLLGEHASLTQLAGIALVLAGVVCLSFGGT